MEIEIIPEFRLIMKIGANCCHMPIEPGATPISHSYINVSGFITFTIITIVENPVDFLLTGF